MLVLKTTTFGTMPKKMETSYKSPTKNLDINDILVKLGYANLTPSGGYYRVNPEYRKSSSRGVLSINEANGSFNDWARAGDPRYKGDIAKLVSLHLDCSRQKALEWLDIEEFSDSKPDKTEKTLELKKTFRPSDARSLIKDHSYWESRGVSKKTLDEFKGGIDDGIEGGKLYNRYVFPIFDTSTSRILGFTGRDLTNKHPLKWKILGKKSDWLYPFFCNKNHIKKLNQIILVESIGDMLSLWENGVMNTIVTFGLSISPRIRSLLINSGMDDIFISFNNDSDKNDAGNIAAYKAKETLQRVIRPDKIKVALPLSSNDFGEMKKEEIREWRKNNEIHI